MEKLNLTPNDIFEKSFKIDMQGYSASEVDQFMDLILEDYQIAEDNYRELEEKYKQLLQEAEAEHKELLELRGKQRVVDLSNTTSYSSVDLLKRVSRLEQEVFGKD